MKITLVDNAHINETKCKYITITKGMSGWFAVVVWWNTKDNDGCGFWEPWNTGIGRYETELEAYTEALSMGDSEELPVLFDDRFAITVV